MKPVGMDQAGHGEAVKGLGVLHRVPARQDTPGFCHLVGSAFQDLVHILEGKMFHGHGHHVHRGYRKSSHGVDVGQGVGGRDLSIGVRIVDDRGEEIQGLHHRQFVTEAVDRGVV